MDILLELTVVSRVLRIHADDVLESRAHRARRARHILMYLLRRRALTVDIAHRFQVWPQTVTNACRRVEWRRNSDQIYELMLLSIRSSIKQEEERSAEEGERRRSCG